MVDIKQNAPSLNRGMSSIFLVAEKYKPYEIIQRMCDIYWEASFKPKNVYQTLVC